VRIQSFQEFWPFYLSQHSNLYCRVLHFFGTTAFFMSILFCYLINGWQILVGIGIAILITAISFQREALKNTTPFLIMNIVVLIIADWWIVFGVIFAYLCAWIGHFIVEKNRPATFTYPLWSFVGDFRMWFEMCLGRYWNKDISENWTNNNNNL
jgi:hypothetical protein